jgi:hypothetical protein
MEEIVVRELAVLMSRIFLERKAMRKRLVDLWVHRKKDPSQSGKVGNNNKKENSSAFKIGTWVETRGGHFHRLSHTGRRLTMTDRRRQLAGR